jgi:hypothetical protein
MSAISVVMPVLIRTPEQLTMTLKCIGLARSKTKVPFDLIIVESGSQYLIDEADIYVHERVATTPEIGHNLGFRIAAPRSDYVGLLTNDTFVSEGWLEVLLDTFKKQEDCGFSTLGAVRFNHKQEDRIEEGNFFDVALIKSEVFARCGYYDERFNGSWSDPDLLVRGYKEGWKMYRNFNSLVDGLVHATVYMNLKHHENYLRGQQLFREKHEGCGLPIYEVTK